MVGAIYKSLFLLTFTFYVFILSISFSFPNLIYEGIAGYVRKTLDMRALALGQA